MSEEKPQRKTSKQVKRTGDKLSPELPFDRNGPGGRFNRSTQGDFPEETANKTLEFISKSEMYSKKNNNNWSVMDSPRP